MMTEKQLQEMLDYMVILPPMAIEDPSCGFNGYMLRCKAPEEERGSDTILFREPNNPEMLTCRLPDTLKERLEMRKNWGKMTEKGHYACINVDLNDDANWDRFQETFPHEKEELEQVFAVLLEESKKILPSYDVFGAVCHSNQLRVEEGETFMRPPHFHILMKAVRKRTKKELAMLQEG